MVIRKAMIDETYKIAELAVLLWPHHTIEELLQEIGKYLDNNNSVVFLAFEQDKHIGFAQCGLRVDYVEGTDSSPVGYLEGVFVKEQYRNKNIGKTLLDYCEQWAIEKGCKEFASDCELDNIESLNFHLNCGFLEQNRIICFAKQLDR